MQHVRRHAVFDNLPPPLSQDTTHIFVPTLQQATPRCDAFRGHLLMICAAKPRNAAAPTSKHLHVLATRLGAPSTPVASPFHTPGEIVLEMSQRRVLWARIKGKVREVQECRCVTQVQGSLQPLFRLAHSIIPACRCGRMRSWQLRSTSSTPSHVGPDLKSERYTHAQRCLSVWAPHAIAGQGTCQSFCQICQPFAN